MQNIFITGASRGLGLEFTRRFLERGDRVFASCRKLHEAGYLQALKSAFPTLLSIIKLDVSDPNSILDAFAVLNSKVKGLDLLINNAGVYIGRRGSPKKAKVEITGDHLGSLDFDEGVNVFRINTIGPIILSQQFLPLLRNGNEPKIVSITSGYGSISGNNWGSPYHYSASKAALNMYMKSLAVDLKPQGIIVGVISPGWVQTEMGGAGAPLKAIESVDGLIKVIDALTLNQTGTFFDYQGQLLDW